MTWQGLLGYLDNHVVDLVIYENSDKLDDGNEATEENPSKQKLTEHGVGVAAVWYLGPAAAILVCAGEDKGFTGMHRVPWDW